MQLGRRCFEHISQLYSCGAAVYVIMSNIYADAHKWKDADQLQNVRIGAGAMKKAGKAWIEVSNEVCLFILGDKSHSQSDELCNKSIRLGRVIKEEGYMPDLEIVAEATSSEERDVSCGTALSFGSASMANGQAHSGFKIQGKLYPK